MSKTASAPTPVLALAREYLKVGLCVLPACPKEKRPKLPRWKEYQKRLPTAEELGAWFRNGSGACLVAGAVSGNLEMIDFDLGGELYEPWAALVQSCAPGLLERLVIEKSQSGGRHVVYRCKAEVDGNLKLAQREIKTDNDQPITSHGKACTPRRHGDGFVVVHTLIETRGEGGLFLCAPTPGYELMQGDFTKLPVLSESERLTLFDAAWELNECVDVIEPPVAEAPGGDRPGDEFNRRGDLREVLRRNGWTLVKTGTNEHWRRPGKDGGWSATLKDRVFFVFSSNASPFDPNRAYGPFSAYTMLEHKGDFAAAAKALHGEGYGTNGSPTSSPIKMLNHDPSDLEASEPTVALPDPGPLPDELLRVPGFIDEVMEYCLATAPYPNRVMAFCGALALQAFLGGRKVRDEADNRTNIYLLGLAHSAAGKDHPRKLNTRIVHEIGLSDCLGERFASGEGVQDALSASPCMLFQTDEIDGMLQTINRARDARHENVMSTLLTLFSSSNSVYPIRRKAGTTSPGAIVQPNLVIFGTAIPNHYYEALSDRMLTNGFFARMVILESGLRGPGQDTQVSNIPTRVLKTARRWADFQPNRGNLRGSQPEPLIVDMDDEARACLVATRKLADSEYSTAEMASDPVGTTVWGRASEQIRKLALIYAISENNAKPRITARAVEWASKVVLHQTRRMLYMASYHVADNPFHAECLKLLQKLRDAPDQELPHSVLLKRMKMEAKRFEELTETLEQRGDVEIVKISRAGSPQRFYRLRGESRPERVKREGFRKAARG